MANSVTRAEVEMAAFFIEVASAFTKAKEVVIDGIDAIVVGETAQVIAIKGPLAQISVDFLTTSFVDQRKAMGFLCSTNFMVWVLKQACLPFSNSNCAA